jgi:hypothetical protein
MTGRRARGGRLNCFRVQWKTNDIPSTTLFDLGNVKLQQAVEPMQQLLSEQTHLATWTASVAIDLPGLAHGHGSEGQRSRQRIDWCFS